MPDIAMCQDEGCPKRNSCYRFIATPTPGRQTYAYFERKFGTDRCPDYIEAHSKSQIRRVDSQKK